MSPSSLLNSSGLSDPTSMSLIPYVTPGSTALLKKRMRQTITNGDIDIADASTPLNDLVPVGDIIMGGATMLGAPPISRQDPLYSARVVNCGTNIPNLDDVLINNIPVIRHVSREAIDGFTSEFIKVLDNLFTLTTLTHYFLFTKLSLFLPRRGGKRHQHALARTIQLRLDRWAGEDYLGLFMEAQQKPPLLQSRYELRSSGVSLTKGSTRMNLQKRVRHYLAILL